MRLTESEKLLPDGRVMQREDAGGGEGGVDRPGFADGKGHDGHSGGHLHGREEAVHALESPAFDGHAENRQVRLRRCHPGEVSGSAGRRDDDLQAAFGRRLGKLSHPAGGAVGTDDPGLVRDAKLRQALGGVFHGLPIGDTAHDDGHLGSWIRVFRFHAATWSGRGGLATPEKAFRIVPGPLACALMRCVIVGAGEVGSYLSSLLSNEEHEVTMIEASGEAASRVDEEQNVRVIEGNGSSAGTLREAGADECDCFLALTSDDRTNLLASSLAKALGAKQVICRVHDETYADNQIVNYQLHFGIDHLVNPEALCAVELAKAIRHPGRVAVESFARGQIEVQHALIRPGSKLVGRTLRESALPPNLRIGAIQRGEEHFVASADTTLEAGDRATVFGPADVVYAARRKFDPETDDTPVRVVIAGAGETTIALLQLLKNPRFRLRVIDPSAPSCKRIAERFANTTVIHGDPASLRLLEEEQIGEADYFAACTRVDETNIVTGLQAAKMGVEHVMAVINKPDYAGVLDALRSALGFERAVSPRLATANEVMRLITDKPFVELASLAADSGSIIELRVSPDAPAAGKTLREIPWPPQTVVVALQHKFDARVPGADDKILGGDRVAVIVSNAHRKQLLELLRTA